MTNTTETKWRALIAAQELSGRSVRQFAAEQGVNATTLYWWRSRLRARRTQDLVPVQVVEAKDVVGERVSQSGAFELRIDDALALQIPARFDEAELRRLVRALRC